jgi:hypothetical protein
MVEFRAGAGDITDVRFLTGDEGADEQLRCR